jgi:hypothetical protein
MTWQLDTWNDAGLRWIIDNGHGARIRGDDRWDLSRGVGGLQSHAVVSVVRSPLPSRFRPHHFRSEATAYVDNRREVVILYGPLALSGQPMITQHRGPVLIAPGRRVPSRDPWPAFER